MGFFENLGKRLRAKRYTGLIAGGLPIGKNWSDMSYLKANDVSLYTNRAVGRRAQKVGEIEFVIKNQADEVIENDPLLKLLNRPNELFSGFDFWQLNQTYIDVVGNSYIWLESGRADAFSPKAIKGMHILRPDLVKPIVVDGVVTKYEYQLPNKTVTYEAEEILHMFRPDPLNPLQGVSILKAGIHAIQTEQQIGAYHARILENGGKIEGVMKFTTERLTKEQLDELKANYEKEYADARNAGRPLFLGGDAAYENLGLTPNELSYIDAKKLTLEDIVIMTGVPKVLLGTVDDVQYSNSDTSMRMFLRETVKPLMEALADALNNKLGVDGKTISYIDPTPENIDEKIKIIETAVKNFLVTPNEGRRLMSELLGEELPDIEGGNELYQPFNLLPVGTERISYSNPPDAVPESEETKSVKATPTHPLSDPDVRKAWGEISIKRADIREARFEKELNRYFESQKVRLVEAVQPQNKHVFRKKGLFDEVADEVLELKIGVEMLLPSLTELLIEAGEDAMRLAGSEYAFNMSSDLASWMEKRTNVFVGTINQTTFNKLRNEFEASFDQGENRQELVERIQNVYGGISEGRASTIARTEVHNATQYATIEGYRQAGLETKIWTAVGDFYTRDSHLAIDGQERPLDMPFSNGLMFPGDPNGSAGEVINCRCTL